MSITVPPQARGFTTYFQQTDPRKSNILHLGTTVPLAHANNATSTPQRKNQYLAPSPSTSKHPSRFTRISPARPGVPTIVQKEGLFTTDPVLVHTTPYPRTSVRILRKESEIRDSAGVTQRKRNREGKGWLLFCFCCTDDDAGLVSCSIG